MNGPGLLKSFVSSLIYNIPMWFLLLFALVFYLSRRDERPRAARLVLVSIIISGLHMLLMPIVFQIVSYLLINNGMDPGEFSFRIISAVMSLPSVLAHGLLFYAALMPDDADGGSRSYRRRYDEDDDRDDR
ncbi:MAG: hypothetical protein KDA66_15295 [Planctomycetaceae bacterium]|nr:hypothetical protein [Planctomycetaceae bacterium]